MDTPRLFPLKRMNLVFMLASLRSRLLRSQLSNVALNISERPPITVPRKLELRKVE